MPSRSVPVSILASSMDRGHQALRLPGTWFLAPTSVGHWHSWILTPYPQSTAMRNAGAPRAESPLTASTGQRKPGIRPGGQDFQGHQRLQRPTLQGLVDQSLAGPASAPAPAPARRALANTLGQGPPLTPSTGRRTRVSWPWAADKNWLCFGAHCPANPAQKHMASVD
ncbi:hypothetical protein FALBO_12505 [Fusarium albosuccineum]|uniref:Uncharacterized protein n=1 Tax=Fusarium albosuccineum TaxID=1237068 RepID=A0A8H4L292_9HYPO|nr:hypothetical protein FALBO_12505 [Fusarium albosuccineum]